MKKKRSVKPAAKRAKVPSKAAAKARPVKAAKSAYKTYLKPAGKGFEVGLMWGAKPLFVGNFINKPEAQGWYELMNKEYSRFSKKFGPVPPQARAFFHRFISNSMYKHYYEYLDKCFGKYTKNYHREFHRDEKKFQQMRRHWEPRSVPYTRRAA